MLNLLDFILSAGFVVAVFGLVLVVILLIAIHIDEKKSGVKSGPPPRVNTSPTWVTAVCPYCGEMATMCKQRNVTRCGECYREFGDARYMTEAERQRVAEIDEDCARADRLENLEEILNTAVRQARICRDGGFKFEGGKMYAISFDHVLRERSTWQVIGHYEGVHTKAGTQHLARLCAEHCIRHGVMVSYNFAQNGIYWPKYVPKTCD